MADIVPLKVVKTTGNTTGLAEAQTGETVGISHGGTGQTTQQAAIDALTAVSAASTGQVLTKDSNGNAKFQTLSITVTDHEFNMHIGVI